MPLIAPEVTAVTGIVVAVKVTVVAPSGTTTLAGTVAAALAEARVIVEPPVGAGPLIVRVPVEGVPPCMLVGDIAMLVSVGVATMRLQVFVAVP